MPKSGIFQYPKSHINPVIWPKNQNSGAKNGILGPPEPVKTILEGSWTPRPRTYGGVQGFLGQKIGKTGQKVEFSNIRFFA